jgi:hypothetical protein
MIEADDELKKSGSEYSYTSTGSDGVSLTWRSTIQRLANYHLKASLLWFSRSTECLINAVLSSRSRPIAIVNFGM